ncbi:MAG: Rpn family recombination-promoting nuclease/putative transposase [Bacillota bacterium]|nr:Rpn family recombination-promoting nuclease/putative transposase [Bacillota bacterium]
MPEDIRKYIPNYEYLIYDLSKFSDDEIKGEVKLRILLTIFRDILTKDNKGIIKTILKASELLRKLEDKEMGIEYFETFMRYIINSSQNITKKDIYKIIEDVKKTYPEGS